MLWIKSAAAVFIKCMDISLSGAVKSAESLPDNNNVHALNEVCGGTMVAADPAKSTLQCKSTHPDILAGADGGQAPFAHKLLGYITGRQPCLQHTQALGGASKTRTTQIGADE